MDIQFVHEYRICGQIINDGELLRIEKDFYTTDKQTGETKLDKTTTTYGGFVLDRNDLFTHLWLDISQQYNSQGNYVDTGMITRVIRSNGQVLHVNGQQSQLISRKYLLIDGVEYNTNDRVQIQTTTGAYTGRLMVNNDKYIYLDTSDQYRSSNESILYSDVISIVRV